MDCRAFGGSAPAVRYQAYLRCLEPSPVIVLGSRHAVYAPAHNLGLILVIDDADSAHREPLAPYPHTRDVALVRNSVEGIAVCFASVTPSLAVSRWIDMGYVEEVFLGDVSRPRVIPTSLALHHDSLASPARLPSTVYQAVKKALSGPVLVPSFPQWVRARPVLLILRLQSVLCSVWRTTAKNLSKFIAIVLVVWSKCCALVVCRMQRVSTKAARAGHRTNHFRFGKVIPFCSCCPSRW